MLTNEEIIEIGRETLNQGLTHQKVTPCTDVELIRFVRKVLARELAVRNDILAMIAYPRRGTDEDLIDIYGASDLIQGAFTAEELGR